MTKCEYCNKDFKRLDRHICKKKAVDELNKANSIAKSQFTALAELDKNENDKNDNDKKTLTSSIQNEKLRRTISNFSDKAEPTRYITMFHSRDNFSVDKVIADYGTDEIFEYDNKLFTLREPAYIYRGKAMFFCSKDFGVSFYFELAEGNTKIKEVLYSPAEVYNRVKSQYLKTILGVKPKITITVLVALVSFVAFACMLTYIITSNFYINFS